MGPAARSHVADAASGFEPCQLRTSSSAACASQVTEETRLGNASNVQPRKYLILLILLSWLAALDDFRNWLIREAA
jgi:hypothetical protein